MAVLDMFSCKMAMNICTRMLEPLFGNNQELNLKAPLYMRETEGVEAGPVAVQAAGENTAMTAGGIAPIDCRMKSVFNHIPLQSHQVVHFSSVINGNHVTFNSNLKGSCQTLLIERSIMEVELHEEIK